MDYVYISAAGSSSSSELLTDLTELCVDMMARYTFSNISSQPMRSVSGTIAHKEYIIPQLSCLVTTACALRQNKLLVTKKYLSCSSFLNFVDFFVHKLQTMISTQLWMKIMSYNIITRKLISTRAL